MSEIKKSSSLNCFKASLFYAGISLNNRITEQSEVILLYYIIMGNYRITEQSEVILVKLNYYGIL